MRELDYNEKIRLVREMRNPMKVLVKYWQENYAFTEDWDIAIIDMMQFLGITRGLAFRVVNEWRIRKGMSKVRWKKWWGKDASSQH